MSTVAHSINSQVRGSRLFVAACAALRSFVLVAALLPAVAMAQSGGVDISIRMNADSVEYIRGWRRANGMDPPDAAADARLKVILERGGASLLDAKALARQRRMERTVVLVRPETGMTSR